MLTMVSYALPKEPNLKLKYTQVIERITEPIIQFNSLLLNCRLTIMLGYYMDILYKEDSKTFFGLIEMFLQSLTSGKEFLALAIQSSDTLNTIINDNDIIPRIVPILPDLITKVSECVLIVDINEFFDFVTEIFKYYKETLQKEDFMKLFMSLLQRIKNDIDAFADIRAKTEKKNTLKTPHSAQKCWNTIMTVLETKEYLEMYVTDMEDSMKIIFELLAQPDSIDFDDDIVKAMKIIINKTQNVSDVMKILFKCLKNTYEKHHFVYSDLFDCIKAYCNNDKKFLVEDYNNINDIFGFGVQSLFLPDHTCNACVYLIQMFLIFKNDNTESINIVIPQVLEQVFVRLTQKPMNTSLQRIIYGVILASIMSNPGVTFQYLQEHNMLEDVFETILKFSTKRIDNNIERKLHSVVLTNLLSTEELPEPITNRSVRVIQKIVDVLGRTVYIEAKKKKKKNQNTKLSFNQDSYDLDSDLSDESSGTDEDSDYDAGFAPIDDNEEEKKNDGDSTDENEDNEILETEIDIQSSFAIMKTGFNSFDEFNYFKYVISNLYSSHGGQMDALLNQLPENSQIMIKKLLKVQKVECSNGSIHRPIHRVRRRGNANNA